MAAPAAAAVASPAFIDLCHDTTADTTALTLQSTFYGLNITDAAHPALDFTADAAELEVTYDGDVEQSFLVFFSVTLKCSAGDSLTVAWAKNGTDVEDQGVTWDLPSANQPYPYFGQGLVTLKNGDTVSIRVRNNTAAGRTVTAYRGNLVLVSLGALDDASYGTLYTDFGGDTFTNWAGWDDLNRTISDGAMSDMEAPAANLRLKNLTGEARKYLLLYDLCVKPDGSGSNVTLDTQFYAGNTPYDGGAAYFHPSIYRDRIVRGVAIMDRPDTNTARIYASFGSGHVDLRSATYSAVALRES